MTQRRHPTAGMTLVEVLVALAVFAVIGIAAFSMLDQTLRSERIADARLARLADEQRLMQVMTLDTMQMISGSLSRDDTGISFLRRSAVSADGGGTLAVRYTVSASDFVRDIGAPGAEPVRQVLLTRLQGASWQAVQDGAALPADASLSTAEGVELVLNMADNQALRGVFSVPHDAPPTAAP